MLARDLTRALDPAALMREAGLDPQPHQLAALRSTASREILLWCRQSGKTTTASARAVHRALYKPGSLTVVVSPTEDQSVILFRRAADIYRRLGGVPDTFGETQLSLELANKSRIIARSGNERSARGFSPDLLILEEAARIDDETIQAVLPSLARTKGDLLVITTPFGREGWFHRVWTEENEYRKSKVIYTDVPDLIPVAEEMRSTMSEAWWLQEFCCEFVDIEQAAVFSPEIVARAFNPNIPVIAL